MPGQIPKQIPQLPFLLRILLFRQPVHNTPQLAHHLPPVRPTDILPDIPTPFLRRARPAEHRFELKPGEEFKEGSRCHPGFKVHFAGLKQVLVGEVRIENVLRREG